MVEAASGIPVLLRTCHSAPFGLYAPKTLADYAARLGYHSIGVVDRHSLAATLELTETASRSSFQPLYAMEVFTNADYRFPVILMALDAGGFRHLLSLHAALDSDPYRESGFAGIGGKAAGEGEGLAGFLEVPVSNDDSATAEWFEQARTLFKLLPKARLYLRLPTAPTPDARTIRSWMDLAGRTGLAPIVLPVATFADPLDAPLYHMGRQIWYEQQREEGQETDARQWPRATESLFRSQILRPRESLETAAEALPVALENARRLAAQAQWRWSGEDLDPPLVQAERGYNPETRLWDQIQEAAIQRWPRQIAMAKQRLYHEFSSLRSQNRMGEFLALSELFNRLQQPELVSVPDRIVGGLLSAHLVNVNPFNPLEQQLNFEETDLKNLRSPIPLQIPDGWQGEILRILTELFGASSVGVIDRHAMPAPAAMKHVVEQHGLEKHPLAIEYLRQCAASTEGEPRWAVVLSRPVERELPTQAVPSLAAGIHRLGIPLEQVLNLPSLVFEMVPDTNKTRLWKLGQQGAKADTVAGAITTELLNTTQEILPLLYPRYGRSVVRLAFRTMNPGNAAELQATLALLELERHDRTGFMRAIRSRTKDNRKGRGKKGHSIRMEQRRKAMEEILAMGKGLFLFRDQLQPLFQRVLELSQEESSNMARKILGPGAELPSNEKIIKEVMPHLNNPELSYTATQFLSLIPRYLCWRQHISDWARNLTQFALIAERNPLEFARVVLDESPHTRLDIAPLKSFLNRRGKQLLPPDVNRSDASNRIEQEGLRLGLSVIETIGPITAHHLEACRQTNTYQSMEEFYHATSRRLVNRRVLRHLVYAGALDSLIGEDDPGIARCQALDTIRQWEEEKPAAPSEKLQTFLFDLQPEPPQPDSETVDETLSEPVDWVPEEMRLFGLPLARSMDEAVATQLPVRIIPPRLLPPHWWLGETVLLTGVLRDIWPYFESEDRKTWTLATLACGKSSHLVVADPELSERLTEWRFKEDHASTPSLMVALVRLEGRPPMLDRLTLGLLPRQNAPALFSTVPHLFLRDFESLPGLVNSARTRTRIVITVEQAQKRFIHEIRSVLKPFRAHAGSAPGAYLVFHCPNLATLPAGLKSLETQPFLPSRMMVRCLQSMDSVRDVQLLADEKEEHLFQEPKEFEE